MRGRYIREVERGMFMSFVYITEDGARIQKKGGKFLVGRNLEILFEIPEETLEGLVLVGSVQVSSQAMIELLRLGIPVTWISGTGKFFGRLESTSHVNVFKQQKQVLLQDSTKLFNIAKQIVMAKVHNQLTVLRQYNRRAANKTVSMDIENIQRIRKNIQFVKDRKELMGYEGMIARVYFHALGQLVPHGFSFTKRTKQPPLDPFNTMLSFGYTLLMYDVYTAISNQGLHPYFGFLHALKNHHPALASDLMEEWRAVLVDSMALSLVHHHEISLEHFQHAEEGEGIFLTREGRKIFIKAYEKKLRSMNQYLEHKQSFRKSLETQAGKYAQCIMDEHGWYRPVYIR